MVSGKVWRGPGPFPGTAQHPHRPRCPTDGREPAPQLPILLGFWASGQAPIGSHVSPMGGEWRFHKAAVSSLPAPGKFLDADSVSLFLLLPGSVPQADCRVSTGLAPGKVGQQSHRGEGCLAPFHTGLPMKLEGPCPRPSSGSATTGPGFKPV